MLAVLGEGGRADALDLAARQGGLEDVRGVHRALGGAGADDGVHLIDEEDDVLGALDLVHHALDALLELAAVLGTGDHQREVEGDDLAVEEDLGDHAGGDLLGEALDDGGLAHAGLADQHRVVLGASAEDLDHAADLLLAADDRIQVAGLGQLREVAPEGLEQREALAAAGAATFLARLAGGRRLVGRLVGGGRILAGLVGGFRGGGGRVDIREDLLAATLQVDVQFLQDAGGDALPFLEEAEQDVLGAHVGVAEAAGLGDGVGHDLLDAGRQRDRVGLLGLLGPGADLLLDGGAHVLEVEAHASEHVDGDAFAELDEPEQDVLGAHVVVVEATGLGPGQLHDLAGAGREIVVLVLVHGWQVDGPGWE